MLISNWSGIRDRAREKAKEGQGRREKAKEGERTYQLVDLELVFEQIQDDDGDGRDDGAERVDRVAVHEGEHLLGAREREGVREGQRR